MLQSTVLMEGNGVSSITQKTKLVQYDTQKIGNYHGVLVEMCQPREANKLVRILIFPPDSWETDVRIGRVYQKKLEFASKPTLSK